MLANSLGVFIETPTVKTYILDLDAGGPYRVTKLSIQTRTGTATIALNRNGVAISGAGSVAVSNVMTTITLSQAMSVDDQLSLAVSATAGAADLSASIQTAYDSIVTVADTPPTLAQGAIWFDSTNLQTNIGYNDGNSIQWTVANAAGPGPTLPLTIAQGGTGATTAPAALTALGAVAKAGDTMTGALNANLNAASLGSLPALLASYQIRAIAPDNTPAEIVAESHGTSVPVFATYMSAGTGAAPAAPGVNTGLSYQNFIAWNGSAYAIGAQLAIVSNENWTASANGTKLSLATVPNGSTSAVASLTLAGNAATFSGTITAGSDIACTGVIHANGSNCSLLFQDRTTVTPVWQWYANNGVAALAGGTSGGNQLSFAANGNATFSGNVSGNVTIPSDTNIGTVFANSNFSTTGGGYTVGFYYTSSSGWKYLATGYGAGILPSNGAIYFYSAPSGTAGNPAPLTQTGYLDISGNLNIIGATATKASGTTWANPSSREIKENIQDYDKGLHAVLALKPRTYRFRDDSGLPTEDTHIGLVHDETSHMPEMHRTVRIRGGWEQEGREVDALDCSAVTWALVNAVKTLAAEIEALKKGKR